MEKKLFSHTLSNGLVVQGNAFNLVQLSAKFQIKCRDYGLTDAESLACWIHGDEAKQCLYFDSVGHANCYADVGFNELRGLNFMSTDEVEDSVMCFEVIEINA